MKSFKTIWKGSLICPFFILGLISCQDEPASYVKLQGEALGTTYNVQYLNDGQDIGYEQIDSMMEHINHALSTYQKNSLISSFNDNDKSIWENPEDMKFFFPDVEHMVHMLNVSSVVSGITGGAFDPTAGALFSAWEESGKKGEMPDSLLIKAILERVGMDSLKSLPNGLPIYKDSLLQLNFNAVAKGHAVDVVAEYLAERGVNDYMVEIGGEVRCSGKNPDGELWSIGLNRPQIGSDPQEVYKVLELDNIAIATSGNYRHFYTINDSILGHTIDPRTGYPAMNELRSVTVYHNYCSIADAYATAFMVLGLDLSRLLVNSDTNISAFFIYEQNDSLKSVMVE